MPINIPQDLNVGHPTSKSVPLNIGNIFDLAINTAVTQYANSYLGKSILEMQLPVPVSHPSPFLLQHEDILNVALCKLLSHVKDLTPFSYTGYNIYFALKQKEFNNQKVLYLQGALSTAGPGARLQIHYMKF
ncbi:hypothetical protein BY996DRAFT_6617528 [Phakopsora pachyrhizi]|nr:hypothetical protein BY996DRAFT_6617528 [Phakopsora pachyrhizi]